MDGQLSIAGATVRVYPAGRPESGEAARLDLISGNRLSCAVSFDEMPPFLGSAHGGIGFNRETMRVQMLLLRDDRLSPWVDIIGGGEYEIEGV